MSQTFVQVIDGEWIAPVNHRGHKMTCCDCGLVHTINFRVVGGRVQFQAFRQARSTAQRRRWLKARQNAPQRENTPQGENRRR